MTDRTTKFLLATIALLLIVLLVRPMALAPTAAQAQMPPATSQASGQMVVDKGEVYVLQNGKLSVFDVEPGALRADPHSWPNVRLRRVATEDMSKL